MLTYKEFSAWIEIEGEEAKEYGIQQSRDDEGVANITCWIASENDKKFTIHWMDSVASTATLVNTSVDGRPTQHNSINRIGKSNRKISTKGFSISDMEIRPFIFSAIQLTDDDQYLENNVSEHFGDIVLKIKRCTVGERSTAPASPTDSDVFGQMIHERSKKAMVHQVSAGPPTQCKSTHFKAVPGPPVVNFIFKYRTLDQLIANGIAPAPPRTSDKRAAPNSEDRVDISEDSAEEEARAEALLAAIREKRAKKRVKREIEEDIKPVFLPGEVIDLT